MSEDLVTRRADLAFGVLEMFATIALFVLLYGILDVVATALFTDVGLQAEGTELSQTQNQMESIWTLLPLAAVFIISLRLIVRAAFESRGGV
jgi:hypothetical protein